MNWFLTSLISLTFFTPCINTQQKYVGNAASKCTSSGETNASESFLYACNGESSSCRAFLIFTARSPFNTVPTIATLTSSGSKLRVPLRCACPTRGQVLTGTKYLLTYSIGMGDTLYGLSKRFNVSLTSITEANHFPDERFAIYPLTTILIPIPREPSSSNTVTRGNKVRAPPFPARVARKHRSKKVLSTAGISAGVFSLVLFLILLVIFQCVELLEEMFSPSKRLVGTHELVYEYMKNGSLQEWLGRRGSDSKKGWTERIQIALDVANGLLYLHNFIKPAYIHNDIRSSNILLDSNLFH